MSRRNHNMEGFMCPSSLVLPSPAPIPFSPFLQSSPTLSSCSLGLGFYSRISRNNCPKWPVNLSYNPGNLGYTPGTIGYTPRRLRYTPGTHGYTPWTFGYTPGTLGYTPWNLGYTPGTLGFISRTLGDTPGTLSHTYGTLKYTGGTLRYSPVILGYTPVPNCCLPQLETHRTSATLAQQHAHVKHLASNTRQQTANVTTLPIVSPLLLMPCYYFRTYWIHFFTTS